MTRRNFSVALGGLALCVVALLAGTGVATAAGAGAATDGPGCPVGCDRLAQTETPQNETETRPDWRLRGEMTATVTRESPSTFRVAVRNAGIARDAGVAAPGQVGRVGDGELRGLSIRSHGGADRFELSVSVADSVRNLSGAASQRLPSAGVLDTPLVYLNGSSDAPRRAYTVTYTLDVGVDDLEERGARDRDAVVLAYHDGEWRPIDNATRVRDGSELVVNATTSGTVPLAFGIRHPNMTVTNVTSTGRLLANRTGTVDATVVNRGSRDGRQTFEIETENETVIGNHSIFARAGQRRTVQVPVTLPRSGEWPIEIGDAETTVRVDAPRPNHVVSNLSIDAERIEPGGTVTVTATVTNAGTADGAEVVRLRAFDTVVDAQRLSLARNETQTVQFTQRFEAAGTYTVAVGNQSRTVVVGDGGATPTGPDEETAADASAADDAAPADPFEWAVVVIGASVAVLFGVAVLGRYVWD
ncbi:CARDB domain-containing protein [Halorientalis halophila]|uniref:CARDB domain-containing protein n=1 Tax=Halorientalis halophila TaxID=3108499 RepID=UPI0030084E97